MKRVLWVSRHEMTTEQLNDLARVMASDIELTVWNQTVSSVKELAEKIAAVDALAVVLPPDLLEELLDAAGEKPVLRAIAERRPTGRIVTLPDGRHEEEFEFAHAGWEQILSARFRTRRL